jgi:hypothetical protein
MRGRRATPCLPLSVFSPPRRLCDDQTLPRIGVESHRRCHESRCSTLSVSACCFFRADLRKGRTMAASKMPRACGRSTYHSVRQANYRATCPARLRPRSGNPAFYNSRLSWQGGFAVTNYNDSPCVCRKLKLGHNGDAVRRGLRRNGCSQLVEPGARTARAYPASDAFAIHYSRRHRRLESGAGAPRPVQRNGQDIPVGSIRLIFPQNSSAKASRGRWVCHGCPWLACGV